MWLPYEPEAVANAFEAHASDGAYNAHYDRPSVLELVGDVQGLRVLDAGCGPGLYAEELLARGAEVVGFDANDSMLALAKQRLGDRVSLRRAILGEPLPFEDASFDLVLCALAIHHAADRPLAFREFFRVLRPGGVAVVSTQHPTADWLRKGGSYFETRIEEEQFERPEANYTMRFWREPLTALCSAITDAEFLIERLVEPRPAEPMRERWPELWERLNREPAFLVVRIVKPDRSR